LGKPTTFDCCTDSGVVCSNGRVISFIVPDRNLSGNIPSEIGNLTELELLGLYKNNFSGPIPPEIGKLTKLKELNLRTNILSGNIPPEIGNLKNLVYISLSFNRLEGPIPKEIGNLSSLQKLYMRYNSLSGNIPHEIGKLTNLVDLNISNNSLNGELPSELADLPNIQNMELNNNYFCGYVPSGIENITNLNDNPNINEDCGNEQPPVQSPKKQIKKSPNIVLIISIIVGVLVLSGIIVAGLYVLYFKKKDQKGKENNNGNKSFRISANISGGILSDNNTEPNIINISTNTGSGVINNNITTIDNNIGTTDIIDVAPPNYEEVINESIMEASVPVPSLSSVIRNVR